MLRKGELANSWSFKTWN